MPILTFGRVYDKEAIGHEIDIGVLLDAPIWTLGQEANVQLCVEGQTLQLVLRFHSLAVTWGSLHLLGVHRDLPFWLYDNSQEFHEASGRHSCMRATWNCGWDTMEERCDLVADDE